MNNKDKLLIKLNKSLNSYTDLYNKNYWNTDYIMFIDGIKKLISDINLYNNSNRIDYILNNYEKTILNMYYS